MLSNSKQLIDYETKILLPRTSGRLCRWDKDTETCYSPFQPDAFRPNVGPEDHERTICVNGTWYIHQRRYRSPENLRLELERHGFTVLEQSGEVTENAICIHQDVSFLNIGA